MVRGRRVLIAGVAVSVAVAMTAACSGSGSARKAVPTNGAATTSSQWSAGRSHPVADDIYPQYGDPATDVLHYALDVKWDPKATVLTGTATLAVRAAGPTDHFVLDLASNMSADSVSVDGAPVTDVHDGDHLTVPVGKKLP